MPNRFQNPQMQQYFSSLPIYIQETIKQSAVDLQSEEDLKKFAENLMKCN